MSPEQFLHPFILIFVQSFIPSVQSFAFIYFFIHLVAQLLSQSASHCLGPSFQKKEVLCSDGDSNVCDAIVVTTVVGKKRQEAGGEE